MYTHIYQNSYVIMILSFVLLSLIFYVFKIGYNTIILPNGKVIKKFSWKYPLAISLIIWVFWYFYLYPPTNVKTYTSKSPEYSSGTPRNYLSTKTNKLLDQRINMVNWN